MVAEGVVDPLITLIILNYGLFMRVRCVQMNERFIIILATAALSGCEAPQKFPQSIHDVQPDIKHAVAIFDVQDEDALPWELFIDGFKGTDVILLGELHDHVVGHAIQLEIVSEIMARFPGSTLALEMLERDEQIVVDDYVDGLISAEVFAKLTQSTNLVGHGTWASWYQPIVDAAIERNGNIVAANSPRRYVKLSRTSGFEAIEKLPENRRWLVDFPKEPSGGVYKKRFWELAAHGGDDEMMESFYRSQQVWDATMARSVANVKPTPNQKVVLLVGQFHVEFEGGLVQELRRLLPSVNIMVVTIHKELPEQWRREEVPIADVLIIEDLSDL